jgi:DNA polymerase III psi subunit
MIVVLSYYHFLNASRIFADRSAIYTITVFNAVLQQTHPLLLKHVESLGVKPSQVMTLT